MSGETGAWGDTACAGLPLLRRDDHMVDEAPGQQRLVGIIGHPDAGATELTKRALQATDAGQYPICDLPDVDIIEMPVTHEAKVSAIGDRVAVAHVEILARLAE